MLRLSLKGILLLLVLTACTETIPDLEGNLVGYIRSVDEFGIFNNDDAGFRAVATGRTSFTTSTDKDGRFEFRDIPAGTYQLSIFKEGYAVMKEYSIQHLGGGPTILHAIPEGIDKYFICRKPETKISEISVANNTITAKFESRLALPIQMRLWIDYSDIPGFNGTQIKWTETRFFTQKGDVFSSAMDISHFPFVTGQKVCLRARVFNQVSEVLNYYYDPELARKVYLNLGEVSKEFSFIFNE